MPFSPSANVYNAINQAYRDYISQSETIVNWVMERKPNASSLLDVACGTGLHLSYLKSSFDVYGVDISPAMIKLAISNNPGINFYIGDMQDFQINSRFDVVTCLFSSITYVGSIEALNATIANFAKHLQPNGICILEPYIPLEAWRDGVIGFRKVESDDRKIAMIDRADRNNRMVRREIAYIVATSKKIEQIYEEHSFMLFTRMEYENAFRLAGFKIDFIENGFAEGRGMYVGILQS